MRTHIFNGSSANELAQAIVAILEDAYGHSPWQAHQVEADIRLEHTCYILAYDVDQLVGFLALQDLFGELEVTNLAVLTHYRGQGIADSLLGYIAERDEPVFLEVRQSNSVAQALYRKHGFEAIGTRQGYYYDPIEDAVMMRRER